MIKPTNQTPLGGFEQRLLGELRALVELRAADQALAPNRGLTAPAPRQSDVLWRRASGRSLAAAGALVVAACAAVLVALSAGSAPTLAQAFPILTRPGTTIPQAGLISILQSSGAGLSAARLDVNQARAFETPLGTGYVLTDKQQNLLCVAQPGFPHTGWGATCGRVRDALRDGTGIQIFYGRPDEHQVSVVDILPKGATATIRDPDGQSRPLPLHDGVLAALAPTSAQITTDVAGHATTTDLQRPLGT
ncbi:MAG: hypothetical protein ACR2L9_04645 [Solirubrobacteraceae bacterium]